MPASETLSPPTPGQPNPADTPRLLSSAVVWPVVIVVPVVFLAWNNGGSGATEQYAMFCCVLAAATVAALAGGTPRGEPHGKLCIPPAALMLGLLPVLQLIRWGEHVSIMASRHRLELFRAVGDLGVETHSAISIYRFVTMEKAVLLAACCALFSLSRWTARQSTRSFLFVATGLSAMGVAEAILGMHQSLEGRVLEDAAAGFATGTFVNRDHYAVLLEGCLGLSLGLVAGLMSRPVTGLARALGGRDRRPMALLAGGGAVLCFLGVVLSLSRMGVIVVSIMVMAAVLLAWARRSPAALWAGAIAAGGAGLAGIVGVPGLGAGFARLAGEQGDPGRLAIWADSLRAASDFLWTGSGLGTFAFAFRRTESYLTLKTIDHAHNDYLQAVIELGAPGAALLFGSLAWVLLRSGRKAWALSDDSRRWMAFGCLLGAGGILLHAAADFPLQIPATAALLAVLLGCASGLSDVSISSTGNWARRLSAGWALAFCALGLCLLWGMAQPLSAEKHLRDAQTAAAQGQWPEAERACLRALRANPAAAAAWLTLAELSETRGQWSRAIRATERARRLEPFSVRTEWPLAHLYLRAGLMEFSADQFGVLTRMRPAMRPAVIDAVWSGGMEPGLIASRVVPPESGALGEYLYYLARRGEWEELLPATAALSPATRMRVPPGMLRYVFDKLFFAGRGDIYRRLWMRAGQSVAEDGALGDLLSDEGFGLQWVHTAVPGVRVSSTGQAGQSGSIDLDFEKPSNLHYRHLWRDFLVSASTDYLVEAEVRAQEIESSEGVRLAIVSRAGLLEESAPARGTFGWKKISLRFRSGSADQVLRLMVVRHPSQKLNRFLSGRFHLRGARVRAVSGQELLDQNFINVAPG